MNGFGLLEIEQTRYPSIKVMLMTVVRDEELRHQALARGARCLLFKPVLATDLITCMSRLDGVERL